jgi:uncharacterized protein YndB with AHSA1/START domain
VSQQMSEAAVRKSVTVDRSVEEAFRLYTEQVGTWWPYKKTHSVAEEDVETVILEGRLGGRFYERTKSGEEHLWGTILVWDPPNRVVYSWHPGRGEDTAQQVEVTFTPEGGGTRVVLVHMGWERLGDRMADAVASYDTGWDTVLGRYVAAASGERS